jgi:hypothetical protein
MIHGEDDRFAEWGKEVSRDTAQKEHRQKHDADAQRRNKSRHGNLRGPLQDAVVQLGAFPKVTLDILNGDGCVVD